MRKGIGGHQKAYAGRTDEWLTPPEILHDLQRPPYGVFDLDPCSPVNRPWDTAKLHYTSDDDGLIQDWTGRVWLNPPYGPQTAEWLKKLSQHGNGIALIFARTETAMFFNYVWPKALAMRFMQGRLFFHTVDGKKASFNAGGPSVLIAYGSVNAECLESSSIPGYFVRLR